MDARVWNWLIENDVVTPDIQQPLELNMSTIVIFNTFPKKC